jgi:hypothetical protein
MAKTLRELEREFADASEKARETFDVLNGKAGRGGLERDYNLAVKKNDREKIAKLKPMYDKAVAAYKAAQEAKDAARKELKSFKEEESKAKEKEVKDKVVKNTYDKALENLTVAESKISGYKGEENYITAYRAAEAAKKVADTAGVAVPALPPQKVTVPKVEEKKPEGKKETPEQMAATYSQFLDTLADPKNKQLLIDVQNDLIKKFNWKGKADGQWSTSFQDALRKVEETRLGLPTLLRTDIREFILKPTISTKGIVAGAGAGGPKTTVDTTKSIERMTQADIDAMINKNAQDLLGREITAEDKAADWYKTLNSGIKKMIESGTTYKTVATTRDGSSTGTRTITPGYSPEKAGQLIESTLRTADPESLARKERIDFVSWMFQNLGGRNG